MKANKSVINGYVARDKDGLLYLYIEKPYKGEERWMGYGFMRIKKSLFPFIKWTDKEPTHVNITIEIDK
jgi:hypothetical protein